MVNRTTKKLDMNRIAVIDVVGLSRSVIGDHTPFIKSFIKSRNSFTWHFRGHNCCIHSALLHPQHSIRDKQ